MSLSLEDREKLYEIIDNNDNWQLIKKLFVPTVEHFKNEVLAMNPNKGDRDLALMRARFDGCQRMLADADKAWKQTKGGQNG